MSAATPPEPVIYDDHPLSPDRIDDDAVRIVRRLKKFGYEAYLVGGCVRDLALGLEPKDFDIATSATPREVRQVFRNCRIIGRRFRLCHVFFQEKIIEVATFRTEPLAKLEEDSPEVAERVASTFERHREGAPPRSLPRALPPTAPPAAAGLAPWEVDLESETRERQTIEGRRVRAREEATSVRPDEDDSAAADPEDRERERDRNDGRQADRQHGPGRDEAGRGDADDDRGPRRFERGDRGGERRDDGGRGQGGRRRKRPYLEDEPERYGTADEDARLRDFTINALFYDPDEDCVIDYVGGWQDLDRRIVRIIGDPDGRMIEDPVRIVRAVKFAARNHLRIEVRTWEAMRKNCVELEKASPRRLLEEVLKLLASGAAARCFRLLAELDAVRVILPELGDVLTRDTQALAYRYLLELDRLPREGLDPALLVATLYYPRIRARWRAEGLGVPGDEDDAPPPRPGSEERAEEIAEEEVQVFARRGSMSRQGRAVAVRLVMAQRLLRRSPERQRARAARLLVRDWARWAIQLLRITTLAEGCDPALVEAWERLGEESAHPDAAWAREQDDDDGDDPGLDGPPRPPARRGRFRPRRRRGS